MFKNTLALSLALLLLVVVHQGALAQQQACAFGCKNKNNNKCHHGISYTVDSQQHTYCSCDYGWSGEFCNVCDPQLVVGCKSTIDCHHGVHYLTKNQTGPLPESVQGGQQGQQGQICSCDYGWSGKFCDQCDPQLVVGCKTNKTVQCPLNPQDGRRCSGHGRCGIVQNKPNCFCDYGYSGQACEICSPAIIWNCKKSDSIGALQQSKCSVFNNCSYHGVCVSVGSGQSSNNSQPQLVSLAADGKLYYCACEQGYFGKECNFDKDFWPPVCDGCGGFYDDIYYYPSWWTSTWPGIVMIFALPLIALIALCCCCYKCRQAKKKRQQEEAEQQQQQSSSTAAPFLDAQEQQEGQQQQHVVFVAKQVALI